MKANLSIAGVASFFLITGTLALGAQSNTLDVHTKHDGEGYQVQVVLNDENVLTSPLEGLWSIAMDWQDN